MQTKLPFGESNESELRAISPFLELGAYEALWSRKGMSFKKIAEMRSGPESSLSDFVDKSEAFDFANRAHSLIAESGIGEFGVRVYGTWEYPEKLLDASYPLELLYFQGFWDLAYTKSVSVVGTRRPSAQGIADAHRLVKNLVDDGFTIVSGLASGIDTVAHTTAIESGGQTIGVIGTPISETYPKENAELQKRISRDYLLISQIPVLRYSLQGPHGNRLFFPQRNITMSALSEATIIVEADEMSGTLVQARAALEQKRKLFILDRCFLDGVATWPEKFIEKGGIRVAGYEDIRRHIVSEAL